MPASRRQFLRSSSAFGALALFGQRAQGEQSGEQGGEAAGEATLESAGGFGPLRPVADETTGLELIELPEGFRYLTFGWTRDEMADGRKTPGTHDGMAVVKEEDGIITLVRNHERDGVGEPMAAPESSYDPVARGGCVTLRFDANDGRWIDSRVSLSGTVRNCAGGRTPWGTWLSCEETVLGPGSQYKGKTYELERDHGFVFEVPADGLSAAEPILDMGRFWHEAVAVDPKTNLVYLTEDRSTAGLYRFTPNTPEKLVDGGRLEMLAVDGRTDLRRGLAAGDTFDVRWVPIEDPTRPHSPGSSDTLGVFMQGQQQGGAIFGRLEGCDYRDDRIFVTATIGGDRQAGQVWSYDPREERITLLFESPGSDVLDMPDNLCVSPRGGLILCEDGYHVPQRVHALTEAGQLFPLLRSNVVLQGERNNIRGDFRADEWAGATFSSDGTWLFVNNQTPGFSIAITGPWQDGLV